MADLEKEILARAALAAGKDAAKRKLDEVLGEESPDAKATKDAPSSKSRRWKIAIIAVLVLALGIGVIGLMISYWQWFLAAGFLGLAGLYGYYRWRRRKRDAKAEAKTEVEAEAAPRAAKEAPKARVVPEEDQDAVALQALEREKAARERARQAEAAREARAQVEAEVDEELAAMKARLKK